MNSTYQSIDDLLQWFSEAPRTKRWDALLAFDQATVNTLLLQQYIERFNSDSYLPPINETIELGSGSIAEIRGYVFDRPRLSFENANLDVPTATLRMQGMGGVRFNWNVAGSTRKLESIAYEYPVNGDVHESTVTLKDNSVSINNHRVIIDVGDGASPVLKFGGALNEKKRAGEKIKSVLGLKPPEVREYVLSELKGGGDPLFVPGHIMLLTQPAPANRQRGTAQYGDGAVLAFVALGDGTPGDRPTAGDPQWRYLLDPSASGHSVLMVLSHEWWVSKFLLARLNEHLTVPAVVSNDGPWKSVTASSGTASVNWIGGVPAAGGYTLGSAFIDAKLTLLPIGGGVGIRIRHVADGIQYDWAGEQEDVEGRMVYFYNNVLKKVRGSIATNSYSTIEASLDADKGWVSLVPTTRETLSGTILSNFKTLPEAGDVDFGSVFAGSTINGWTESLAEFNTVHLANIVLAGKRPIQLKGAKLPGDLVMYGDISNERTGLVLNKQEVLIGASTRFQFTATGAGAVTWALELVDGTSANPNDAGTITADGHYTAPAVTSSYARVRLTARRGDLITLALITVVRELAAVSPAIQLAVVKSPTRYFVRGGATGDWAWDTSGLKGTLQEPVPEPGDEFEPGDMQYVPPATIDSDFIVEEIKIKVGNNITTSRVVVTKGGSFDIAVTLSDDFKTATLSGTASGNPLDNVVYSKVAGSGALNGDVVTSEDNPAEPFIVVQGDYTGVLKSYLLLPLPLSVLDGTRSRAILQDPSQTF